jgi:hypothetical protein
MSDSTTTNSSTYLSPQEAEALNKHGVFFKKRVLHELKRIPDLGILAEELGVAFGGTRVIDIVALDTRVPPPMYFVFECKRAYALDKRWLFFRHVHQRYRVLRIHSNLLGHSSAFANGAPAQLPVCSEGYEFGKSDLKADQNPIFQAASQLSAGYLGLVARRHKELTAPMMPSALAERYVPVLVTNAELLVVEEDAKAISLETGNIAGPASVRKVDHLILKHPFPTPEGLDRDFRDSSNPPAPPETGTSSTRRASM